MESLNIRSETMLGTSHSWAVTMRNLLTQFQKQGHKLYLSSINGDELIPHHLKSRLGREIQIPDIDICYTMPRNFESRFKKKSKLKLAIYNYETDKLPKAWLDSIKYVDYVLPSSFFSKEVFVNSGWPEKKCVVIPHGINPEDFVSEEKLKLNNQKGFKFLNISIPHYRKNIDLLLESYYSAFSASDDVCLVLKTDLKLPKRKLYSFEINLGARIREIQKKHFGKSGGLPQVEIIQDRLPDIVPLYKSCDVLVSASSSEGFGLPLLEALASGIMVIAPRCTGQLDFLNDQNSILVDVDVVDAGPKYQYWVATPGAKTYLPKSDDLSQAMINIYNHRNNYKQKFELPIKETVKNLTWENAAKKILDIK